MKRTLRILLLLCRCELLAYWATVFTSLLLGSSTAPNPILGGILSTARKVVTEVSDATGSLVSESGYVVGDLVSNVFANLVQVVGQLHTKVTGLLEVLLKSCETIEGEHGEKLKKHVTKTAHAWKEANKLAKDMGKAAAEDAHDTVKELHGLLEKAVKKVEVELAAIIDIGIQISDKAGDDVSLLVEEVKAVVLELKKSLSNVDNAEKSKTTEVVELSDQLKMLIASSDKALDKCMQVSRKTLDEATGEDKDGQTEVNRWLTKDFKPLVAELHSKILKADQETSAYRKALASELTINIERISEKMKSFKNIPAPMQKVMKETIGTVVLPNAQTVVGIISSHA